MVHFILILDVRHVYCRYRVVHWYAFIVSVISLICSSFSIMEDLRNPRPAQLQSIGAPKTR